MSNKIPVNITEMATREILSIINDDNNLDLKTSFLRIGVAGPTCNGMGYMLDFEKSPKENDQIFEHNDIKVIIDDFSIQFLEGATVDYIEDISGSGFKIDNPNLKNECGDCSSC